MRHVHRLLITALMIASACAGTVLAQSSTGSLCGTVVDQHGAVITGAIVTIKSIETGSHFTAVTVTDGRYRFVNVPIGTYELTAEAVNFKTFVQGGITLNAGEEASVDVPMEAGLINEVVGVDKDVPILNLTTAEVSTRFDSRRLSELPIAPNRSVYSAVLSAPGVNQLAGGQTAFALGTNASANGGRLRSNNFMLDGQDMNEPAISGTAMPINNADAIQEVRIVTNQFLPEHGHNSGLVLNVVTRSGTDQLHGSAFWFFNSQDLNACSNLDKKAGFCNSNGLDRAKRGAPTSREDQFGFTIGGPVVLPAPDEVRRDDYDGPDRTFFFSDYQRWSDRRRRTGLKLSGAPTMTGREALQLHAGHLPQVVALLRYLPAGTSNGRSNDVSIRDVGTFPVELGDLTGSSDYRFKSDQGSVRVDHRYNKSNLIYGRFRISNETTTGAGQVTPPGLTQQVDRNSKAATIVWTTSFSTRATNEARIAVRRGRFGWDAEEPGLGGLPSIQIQDLGLKGAFESDSRTALGLPTNLPNTRIDDMFQVTDALSLSSPNHILKFGVELRRTNNKVYFPAGVRGSLSYSTLSDFLNDRPSSAAKSFPVPGGDQIATFSWREFYWYAQDQWKIRPNLTLVFGVRYEYPGDSFQYLRDLNERVLAANSNHPAFRFDPGARVDTNNWMPRVGFTWNPTTSKKSVLGFITGGDKLVIRGGYARAYDVQPVIININTFGSFPFTATRNFLSAGAPFSYTDFINTTAPVISNPWQLSRTTVAKDFRAPATDQFSFDIQRELRSDVVFRLGYIRTRGTGLLQSIDGNPRLPCPFGTGDGTCNTTGIDRNTGGPLLNSDPIRAKRVDPSKDIVIVRANTAASTYNALQASLEKRLGNGVAFGAYYTWSSFLDTSSDFHTISASEPVFAQDAFDRNSDWARSAYDRPQTFSANLVYELPFFSKQRGFAGMLLGGWQINSFLNFQSGAPFSPVDATDPAGTGNPVRPNLFTNLDIQGMTIAQLYSINQQLTAQAWAQARQIFNSLPTDSLCVPRWLPGPPLPFTLFTAPRGRITCDPNAPLVIEFNGIHEGQRVGNAGRNILRSAGLRLINIGVIKTTRLTEEIRLHVSIDAFNSLNTRNFGVPSGVITSPDFLNQWATDGGSRRIRIGARLVF